MTQTTLAAGLALMLGLGITAPAAALTGTYTAAGTGLDGAAYAGTARIEALSDTTCAISWDIAGVAFDGICMRAGDVFSIGYITEGAVGLGIYRIGTDGVLRGVWTVAGEAGSGTETLTPAP